MYDRQSNLIWLARAFYRETIMAIVRMNRADKTVGELATMRVKFNVSVPEWDTLWYAQMAVEGRRSDAARDAKEANQKFAEYFDRLISLG